LWYNHNVFVVTSVSSFSICIPQTSVITEGTDKCYTQLWRVT